MKKIISLLLVLSLVFVMAGCATEVTTSADNQATTQSTSTEKEETTTAEVVAEPVAPAEITGEVTVSGSTSVQKVAEAEIAEFTALNPGVKVTYEAIGSSGGVKNANDGVSQIGTASRELKADEKEFGMTETVIAYDGVAVITHPTNTLVDLTMEQILKIYKGEITNWSEVGGEDKPIVVVSREDGSGTRGAFEELVKFENELTKDAVIAEGNGSVQTTVAGNPNAIGYVSFSYVDATVKQLTVEGVAGNSENVLNATYKISRPFLMVYHDDKMTDAAKAFIDFILSDDGQAIAAENHAIPVK